MGKKDKKILLPVKAAKTQDPQKVTTILRLTIPASFEM
jgi:hypothetical protein